MEKLGSSVRGVYKGGGGCRDFPSPLSLMPVNHRAINYHDYLLSLALLFVVACYHHYY